MDKHLHIVAFDVPWPADYGGVMDVFYTIVSLYKAGCKIHLHCFTSHRTEQPELQKYCETVHYYKRKKLAAFSFTVPYIVQSRSSGELIKRLKEDTYPVLLEGIHCTYFLHSGALKGRKVFTRLHNTEYEYYRHLAKQENNIFTKIYFSRESRLLKKYEAAVANKAPVWALSSSDMERYKNNFNAKNIYLVPAFVPWQEIKSKTGKGNYCLYHGNLTINENSKAAAWL
ncbi:MAG TPA: hypothetical protein VK498_02865, partial [Ferruginibacter sp.]|nr:hypothetical protein [Ferruginibacter sp.]